MRHTCLACGSRREERGREKVKAAAGERKRDEALKRDRRRRGADRENGKEKKK